MSKSSTNLTTKFSCFKKSSLDCLKDRRPQSSSCKRVSFSDECVKEQACGKPKEMILIFSDADKRQVDLDSGQTLYNESRFTYPENNFSSRGDFLEERHSPLHKHNDFQNSHSGKKRNEKNVYKTKKKKKYYCQNPKLSNVKTYKENSLLAGNTKNESNKKRIFSQEKQSKQSTSKNYLNGVYYQDRLHDITEQIGILTLEMKEILNKVQRGKLIPEAEQLVLQDRTPFMSNHRKHGLPKNPTKDSCNCIDASNWSEVDLSSPLIHSCSDRANGTTCEHRIPKFIVTSPSGTDKFVTINEKREFNQKFDYMNSNNY